MSEIRTLSTTKGLLNYRLDGEDFYDLLNPQTVDRYQELRNRHLDFESNGIFCAFSEEQFAQGFNALKEKGKINSADELVRVYPGTFATAEGGKMLESFYGGLLEQIKDECDPQEVYCYEFNNAEAPYAWEGDKAAIQVIIDIWGADVARTIKRRKCQMTVDQMTMQPIEKEALYAVLDGEKFTPQNLWFSSGWNDDRGACYSVRGGCLCPVHTSSGERYNNVELAGLSAHYDGVTISDFYKD